MGLESAELRLLAALRERTADVAIEPRVVGGRAARRYAREIAGRWVPSRPGSSSPIAYARTDLVHLLDLHIPPPRHTPYVAVVHDLAGHHFDDEAPVPPWASVSLERATRVIAVSAFAGEEVATYLGVDREKIRVVPNGPGALVHADTPELNDLELEQLGLDKGFVLRLGGYTRRKNVPFLLGAWPRIRAETGAQLALVGPPHPLRDQYLDDAADRDGIVVLDYVPAELVPKLMRSAAVLASPSLYEGFGLPVLEAMIVGTPVVAVRIPAVEEVCGPAGLLTSGEPDLFADAVIECLSDETLRSRMAQAGRQRAADFTWSRAADRVLSVYKELA